MTAQVLSAMPTKSKFGRYILCRLGNMKFFLILMCIFSFLAYPLFMLLFSSFVQQAMLTATSGDAENIGTKLVQARMTFESLGITLHWLGILGIVVMTYLSVFGCFRTLFRKKYVIMDMTLPISFNERFFGDLIAAVIVAFVPHVLALLFGNSLMDSLDPSWIERAGIVTNYPVNTEWATILLSCVQIFFMTLAVGSLCAHPLSAMIHTSLIQLEIPCIGLMLYELSLFNAYGATSEAQTGIGVPFVALSSPIGLLFSFGYHNSDPDYDFGTVFSIIIYCLALLIASYFIQRHRRAERTGGAYAFMPARYLLTGMFILAETLFFLWRIEQYNYEIDKFGISYVTRVNMISPATYCVLWIVITVAAFVIGEVFGGAKLRQIKKTLIGAGVIAAGCVLFIFGGKLWVELTFNDYIPAESEVERVVLEFYNDNDNGICDNPFLNNAPYEQAVNIHKTMIKERTGESGIVYSAERLLWITYRLKNGLSVTRAYEVDRSHVDEIYGMLYGNGAFVEQYDYPNQETRGYSTKDSVSYFDKSKLNTVYVIDRSAGEDSVSDTQYMIDSHQVFINVSPTELIDTMKKDAANITFDDIYRRPTGDYFELVILQLEYTEESMMTDSYGLYEATHTVGSPGIYKIYPSFKNTIELLKAHGYDPAEHIQQTDAAFLMKLTGSENDIETFYSAEGLLDLERLIIEEENNEKEWGYRAGSSLADYYRRLTVELRSVDVTSQDFGKLQDCTSYKTMYSEGSDRYFLITAKPDYSGGVLTYRMTFAPIVESAGSEAAAIFGTLPEATTDDVNYYRYYGSEELKEQLG